MFDANLIVAKAVANVITLFVLALANDALVITLFCYWRILLCHSFLPVSAF